MDINKTVALKRVLNSENLYEDYVTPNGCDECPFGTVDLDNQRNKDAKLWDEFNPEKAYYKCALLDKSDIYGYRPVCEAEHWRLRALKELEEL
jgi:hypothetical protein